MVVKWRPPACNNDVTFTSLYIDYEHGSHIGLWRLFLCKGNIISLLHETLQI